MDREVWKVHLAQAEQAVALGDRHIATQKELIAKLERRGHDSRAAQELLAQFESLQVLHVAHRNRLIQSMPSGPVV